MRPEELVIAGMLTKEEDLDKIEVKDPRQNKPSEERDNEYGQDDINTPKASRQGKAPSHMIDRLD